MSDGSKSPSPDESRPGEPGADAAPEVAAWWRRWWANPAYRFVALFLVYLLVVSFGYPPLQTELPGFFKFMMKATAWIEYQILHPFTDEVMLSGAIVAYHKFYARIIIECTGIYEMLIFAAAVFAFPTSWKKRAVGILGGLPMLYVFNVVRILFLILVGAHSRDFFDFMHLYFMQATLILMITSTWLLWIFWVVRDDDR